MTLAGVAAAPASARSDGGHGFGRMGPAYARTTTVSPTVGPDFELPFLCGQRWTGSTRSGHSPSYNTIDFNAPSDLNKPVVASAPGVVTRAVSLTGSYGRYVIVDHGRGYTTLYAHLNKISAVVGQVLDQGELVGYLGSSGNSTGPHLHFEERLNGAYLKPYFHRSYFRFGSTVASANCGDRPVTGDWDKDGRDDVGVYRNAATTGRFYLRTAPTNQRVNWGLPSDVPVTGDYDGDKSSQIGVKKLGSGTWWLRSASGARATVTGVGAETDVPITGDWDGNGRANLGFFRPSTHTFYLRADDRTLTSVRLGADGEEPATGDWNGDGVTDLAVFNHRTGYWTLRVPSSQGFSTTRIRYGTAGDRPAAGDWNGDGITELGVWRPANGKFYQRGSTTTIRYGAVRG
ncbi:MAG TPA: VCBS repeat domain-containing M23 family metallopeptidase [Marmoricola sp.]|nr:VCBS repeat domain-containing M23 family metallopeptidase [Marmoricola sp.]